MKQVISQFTRYEFDNEVEQMSAMALSPLQRALIVNEMAIVNERILTLEYDPKNPMLFIQQDAGLKGQSSAFGFLLSSDDQAQEFFKAAREISNQDQSTNSTDAQDQEAFQSLFPK